MRLVIFFLGLWLSLNAFSYNNSIEKPSLLSLSDNFESSLFTKQELSWIQANPIVTFTGDPNWLPYEAFDADGIYKGIVADYLKLIESISGLSFVAVQSKSWTESIQLAVTKQVKIISGDVADDILNKHFSPVDAYRQNRIVIVMNKDQNYIDDLNSIADKKIAIIKDYGYTADIFKTYPDISFVEVENIQEGLEGVSDGLFDAMLATMALASYTISDMGLHNVKVIGRTPILMGLTLFVDKDEPILRSIINKSLKAITNKQVVAINEKWMPQSYVERVDYTLISWGGLVFLFIIGLIGYKNRQLNALKQRYEKRSQRYSTVIETSLDAFFILDKTGCILESNQGASKMLGYSNSEFLSMSVTDFEANEDHHIDKHIDDAKNNGVQHFISKYRKKTGEVLPVEVSINYSDIESGRFFVIIKDRTSEDIEESVIDFRLTLDKQLMELDDDRLLQKALDKAESMTHSQIGFYHFVEEGEDEVALQVWSTNTIETMCFAEGEGAHYPVSQAGNWVDCIRERKPLIFNDYQGAPNKKGTPEGHAPLIRYITVPIFYQDKIKAIIGVGNKATNYNDRDVEIAEKIGLMALELYRLKKTQSQVEFLAYFDPLTKLPNRVLLSDRLNQALVMAKRNKKLVAVCYLDLDDFKPINDSLGHHSGDTVLQMVSERLLTELRGYDTVSRFGGDEYVFVLSELSNNQECEEIIKRILNSLNAPFEIEANRVHIAASIGITLYPDDDSNADALIRHADQAMYQAKQKGKSSYSYYETVLTHLEDSRYELLEEFNHAIKNTEQVIFYYQPKVSLRTGEIIGFEALVRWKHPIKGLLSPNEFLPVIENQPAELLLGERALEMSIQQLIRFNEMELNAVISINISPRQIQQTQFAEYLEEVLKRNPEIEPSSLEFEILEISDISDIELATKVMKQCSALGVRFSLDDFGTGYSSLLTLHRLPIDIVKIDQNFVKNILTSYQDLQIVEGILNLAKKLHYPIVAEGVETIEIAYMLMAMGCQHAQGYGISKPMSEDEVFKWIASWKQQTDWHELNKISDFRSGVIDLDIAVFSHVLWLKQVHKSVLGQGEMPETDEKLSQFYRWYRGIGKVNFGTHSNYAFIQKKHYDVYEKALEIKGLLKTGQNEKAKLILFELEVLGKDLIEYLKKMAQDQ